MTAPTVEQRTLDGNEAVASVAYCLSEVVAIYPNHPVSHHNGSEPISTATHHTG